VLALRLPFLTTPVQGDDVYYLAGAQYAQTDPGHPHHAKYYFSGRLVDMRGHPHPPLDAWILSGLLAVFGDVYEAPFHAAYMLLSLIAALSMYAIARLYTRRALLATALFCAVPAFVVNGNSFESDLPLLAFWMLASALFFYAVERKDGRLLLLAVPALVLTGLSAYQSVVLIPILWILISQKRPTWWAAYLVALTPAVTLATYQIVELVQSGAMPLSVTAGYFQEYGLQRLAKKLRSAAALTGHLGWMLCPAMVIAAFPSRWMLLALLWAFFDPSPLYVVGVAAAIGLLSQRSDRYAWWPHTFFAASLVLFFAGSARYLLPLAAPLVLLVVERLEQRPKWLYAGLAANLALGLALAFTNYQHWDAYRQFIQAHSADLKSNRTWINGEWGMRFYAESLGALPLPLGQELRSGDLVLSSELAYPIPMSSAPRIEVASMEVQPLLPLRLVGLHARSGYSDASVGVRPFDLVGGPLDRIRLEKVLERKPSLSFVTMGDPNAETHLVSGIYQLEEGKYRWMGRQGRILVKPAKESNDVSATIYIPDSAPGREVSLSLNGQIVAKQRYDKPGLYTIEAKAVATGMSDALLTISIDKSFQATGDYRELGLILQQAGLR
jgi:hypothetical protein